MNEIEDFKNGEEHDKFREKLDNKMQRCETNWSRTSLPNEGRQQSQFIYKNNINNYNDINNNIFSVKENYIEENTEYQL